MALLLYRLHSNHSVPNHGDMLSVWFNFGTVFMQIKIGTFWGVLVWVPNHRKILSLWLRYRVHPNQNRCIFWRFGVGSKPCVVPLVPTENMYFPNVFHWFPRNTCVLLVFSICSHETARPLQWFLHRHQRKRTDFTMVLHRI